MKQFRLVALTNTFFKKVATHWEDMDKWKIRDVDIEDLNKTYDNWYLEYREV